MFFRSGKEAEIHILKLVCLFPNAGPCFSGINPIGLRTPCGKQNSSSLKEDNKPQFAEKERILGATTRPPKMENGSYSGVKKQRKRKDG